jgi:mannosyltransferase
VLPRVAYAGSDARSAALEMAGVVGLTLLLARGAVARPGWRWLGYGVGLGVLVALFLDTALVVAAHLVLVVLFTRAPERRAALRRFAAAVGIALVLSAPVVIAGWRQRSQVGFLADRAPTPRTVLVTPWFGDAALAIAAGGLLLLALVVLLRRAPLARAGVVALAGALVPSVVILTLGAALGGFYAARYVGFTAPWVAFLLAVGVEEAVRRLPAVGRTPASAVAIALVASLAAPTIVAQRAPTARNAGTDWNEVAALIGARSHPGDGIAFDDGVRHSRRPRLALHAYPDAFRGVTDLGLVTPYERTAGLWDLTRPLTPGLIGRFDRVWLVTRSRHGADAQVEALRLAGLHPERAWSLDADVVTLWERP